jgi:glycosyltransferase involved in cell wall biosynthesis
VSRQVLRWRVVAPAAAALYRAMLRYGAWWPLRLLPRRDRPAGPRRLAYYHHAFPVLSETFIQREVLALRRAGLTVAVLAHEAHGAAYFDADALALMATTTYLPWLDARQMPAALPALARRHPLRLANSFLYLVLRQHAPGTTWRFNRRLFNRAVHLAGELRARGITHVHCPWSTPDATVALVAAHLVGARYTVQARASDIHRHSAVFGRRERLARAAFVITNTRYNAALLRDLLPRATTPLHVIHNGIDLRRFPLRPRPAPVPGAPLRLLCVGRLTEPKGLEYLLRACASLRAAGLAFTCEIVGGRVANEVNHYLALKKLHRALALDDTVRFAGPQPFDSVLARYAEADVFVLPAVLAADGRREVTPNALIEAMAMQCAVISTPVGGIAEIVEHGVSGLLVLPRDAAALAAAIARLLGDAALREQLGRAARRRVEQHFDLDRNIARYVELFGGADG